MYRLIYLFLFVVSTSVAENTNTSFEGVITYKVEVASSTEKLPIDILSKTYGLYMKSFYKEGYTKVVNYNGDGDWEIYISSENKIYSKLKSDAEPHVYDGADESRQIELFSDEKSTTAILGRKTRLITIQYADGSISKYWYDPKIYVAPGQFEKLKFAYLSRYWETAKAPYLKHERIHDQWSVTYIATAVSYEKLDESIFIP